MARTFYEVLGVDDAASDAEIRTAYREKVKETHPDLSDNADAREDFRRVVRAEEVLSDPDERARYDRLGHDAYVTAREGIDPDDGDWAPWTDPEPGGGAAHAGSGGRSSGGSNRGPGPGFGPDPGPGFDWEDVWGGSGRSRASHNGGPTGDGGTGRTGRAGSGRRERSGGVAAGGAANATGSAGAGATWSTDNVWNAAERQAAWRERREQARSRHGVEDWAGSPYDRAGYINSSRFHWDEDAVGQFIKTQESLLLFVVMLFLYPIFLFSSVTSLFPVAVNALVALCTAGTVVYMLTRPRVALPFFGSFSVLAPLVLVATGTPFASLTGLYVLGVTWIPFIYAGLIGWMLVR